MENNNKALVVATSGYAVAPVADAEVSSELTGVKLRLQRVKVPAGGGILFESPTENPDEPNMVKEIVGVVIHNHPVNAYYTTAYTGGNAAPDCSSADGSVGIVAETGETRYCHKCPFARFKRRGDGIEACDCKQKKQLYIWREGEVLPIALTVPVASVKHFDNYASGLYQFGGKYPSQVLTSITLKKATNKNGIVFSEVHFNKVRNLESDETVATAKMRTQAVKLAEMRIDDDADGE
jgi:hypothetical protein